jgi:hypothetical protein
MTCSRKAGELKQNPKYTLVVPKSVTVYTGQVPSSRASLNPWIWSKSSPIPDAIMRTSYSNSFPFSRMILFSSGTMRLAETPSLVTTEEQTALLANN